MLYCSYFSYAADGAEKRLEIILTPVNDIILRIHRLETQKVITEGTSRNVGLFLEADETTQRDLFDSPQVRLSSTFFQYNFHFLTGTEKENYKSYTLRIF